MRFAVLCCEGAEQVRFEQWLPEHTFEVVWLSRATSVTHLREIVSSGKYDAFLNFCDGIPGDSFAGPEVIALLESLGQPFTGAKSQFYGLTKEEMKRRVDSFGGATPKWVAAFDEATAVGAVESGRLSMPVIVKALNGWGSIGLHESSRCTDLESLRSETAKMVATHGGAIVEEFIAGREATVLVVENPQCYEEPFILRPVEVQFLNGRTFKTEEVKWVSYETDMRWVPCTDVVLADRLRNAAALAWRACGGTGYGRIDFRVRDSDSVPYFLEINANPGMFFGVDESSYGGADYACFYDPGWTHAKFLRTIIEVAMKDSSTSVAAVGAQQIEAMKAETADGTQVGRHSIDIAGAF